MASLGKWCLGLTLNKNEIKKLTVNTQNFCLTKTDSHKLLSDVCPHRGASMSEGKWKNGNLQCPYHGWEFDTKGQLMNVPSTFNIPKSCELEVYDIFEKGGFLWPSSDNAANYCDQLYDTNWTKIYGQKLVEGNIIDWIMNGSDISHINFVHDFADEENGYIDDFKVEENQKYIDCYASVQPKASTPLTSVLQPDSNIGSAIKSRFVFPGTTIIHIKLKDPFEFVTFTTLTPVNSYESMISWAFMYPNKGILRLPFFKERFKQSMYKTVEQDELIIKNLTKVPYKFNVECDEFQLAILKALRQLIN